MSTRYLPRSPKFRSQPRYVKVVIVLVGVNALLDYILSLVGNPTPRVVQWIVGGISLIIALFIFLYDRVLKPNPGQQPKI